MAEPFAWRANEEGAEGTVLDVRFDEGDGIRARDRSSWQNGLFLESLSDESCHSAAFKKVEMPSPWVPHGDGFAMAFGPRGAWRVLGFNTKVNSQERIYPRAASGLHRPRVGGKMTDS